MSSSRVRVRVVLLVVRAWVLSFFLAGWLGMAGDRSRRRPRRSVSSSVGGVFVLAGVDRRAVSAGLGALLAAVMRPGGAALLVATGTPEDGGGGARLEISDASSVLSSGSSMGVSERRSTL
jgi:hypothetical protein